MITNSLFRLGGLLVVLTLVLSMTAFAQTTWYVNVTDGDDGFGAGTVASPYKSISKAITTAATGDIISVAAGIYNTANTAAAAENTLAVTGTKSLTFVATSFGGSNVVTITNGFNMNSSGTVSLGQSGQQFNLGTTTTALQVTQGTLNIATANVVIGSGGRLTINNVAALNQAPTKTTNLNVYYTGAGDFSTINHFPAGLGNGELNINRTAGTLTVGQTLTTTGTITIAGGAAVTFTSNVASGDVTSTTAGAVNFQGNLTLGTAAVAGTTAPATLTPAVAKDLTHNSVGTMTIGTTSSNTLTLYSDGNAADNADATKIGQVINQSTGTLTINAAVVFSVKNNTAAATSTVPVFVPTNPLIYNANVGSGNLTFNSTVTFNNANFFITTGTTNNVPHTVTIVNMGTGTLTFADAIATPLGGASNLFINVDLYNSSTGTVTTRAAALRAGLVSSSGPLTLGQAGDTFTNSGTVTNAAAATAILTVNANATFSGAVSSGAGARININNSNCEMKSTFTNAGTVVLGSNILKLSGTAGVLANTGDIYSTASAGIGTGTLLFTGASPTITGTGNLPAVTFTSSTSPAITNGASIYGILTLGGSGTLTIDGATTARTDIQFNSGNLTLGGAGLTVNGTFYMNASAGTFTFGANTLDLKGNFLRVGGTIDAVAAGTGTLRFSGSASQTFSPGVLMYAFNVDVSNGGFIGTDVVTQDASLIVINNYVINSGRVDMGLSNVRMTQASGVGSGSARFTNGGRGYVATGVGGLIFQGAGANTGGVTAGDGAVMTGTNPFSNVYIRLTTATNNVYCLGAVTISGKLSLEGGGITWNQPDEGADLFTASSLTLNQSLTGIDFPTVVVSTDNDFTDALMLDGVDGVAVPLAITTKYNLTYTGGTSRTVSGEFVAASIQNLSIETTTSNTITGPAANTTITGSLNVNSGQALNLFNGVARTLTASGSVTHTISGSITSSTVGSIFSVTGATATVTGSTVTAAAASIANLSITSASFSSTNLKAVTGTLTYNNASGSGSITMNAATATVGTVTLTAGTLSLSMNSTVSAHTADLTVTAGSLTYTRNGAASGTRTIAGNVTLTAGSLILGSHVDVTGTVSQADGSVNLSTYNLTLTNAYTRTGAGTFSATTGQVIAAPPAAVVPPPTTDRIYTFNPGSQIPNFTISATANSGEVTFAGAGLEVTNAFVHTRGILDLAGFALTVSGNTYTYNPGADVATYVPSAGTAKIILKGTAATATFYADASIPYLEVDATSAGTVTVATSDNVTPTARTVTVTGAFTHVSGALALGINDISLTNTGGVGASYTRTAGTYTATSTGADIGELVFASATGAHTFTPGTGLTIPNIRFDGAAGTTLGGTNAFTVGNNLAFSTGFTFGANNRMVLSDGVTITRSGGGVLSHLPQFGTTVNVSYTGAVTTDKELPTATTVLNNLSIAAAVTLNAPTTVNNRLTLTSGAFTTTSPNVITMAAGATLVKTAGASISAPVVATGSLNLEYSGATATDSNTWPSTATVGAVTFSGAGTKTLHAARTIQGTATFSGGTLDLSNFNLTVQGNVTFSGSGTIKATAAGAAEELIFSGSGDQNVTFASDFAVPVDLNVRLNKGTATALVNLSGGNLDFNTNLRTFYIVQGIMNAGSRAIILGKPSSTTLYVVRTGGMLAGAVRFPVTAGDGSAGTNGRFEFPVGSTTGSYRPVAINFTPTYPAQNPTSIEVTSVTGDPAGTVGFPVDGGAGVKIGGYPSFYWLLKATPSSFGATQQFDVELTGTNLGVPFASAADLRIIRRVDGSAEINPWQLQGSGTTYNNFLNVIGIDSVLTIRTTSSSGGIVVEGTRFTIGVPTRTPVFTTAPTTATVNEGDTLRVTYVADPRDVGETITYSLATSPAATGAAISSAGVVTWVPSFTAAGTYTFTVSANDGQYTTTATTTVTVVNVNRKPTLAAVTAQTITDGQALSVTLSATDPDGDALTYSFVSITPAATANPTVSSAGALSWTPVFADAGKSFTIRAAVSDGVTTGAGVVPGRDSVNISVTVGRSIRRGDANLNGAITASDAAVVLQYTVDLYAPASADSAKFAYAADASGNGTITAFDASRILLFVVDSVANPIPSAAPSTESAASLSKTAVGSVEWGALKGGEQPDVLLMPMVLTGSKDVYSIEISMRVPNGIELKGMSANLPNGWLMEKNMSNGELRVAMAGTTPMASGEFGVLSFKVTDKEARTNPTATVTLNENVSSTMIAQSVRAIPTEFALNQNFPNPFNPSTRIKYQLPVNSKVALEIFNIMGQKVRTLVNTEQESGYYNIEWNGIDDVGQRLASGVYLYRIQAGSFVQTSKMIMLK